MLTTIVGIIGGAGTAAGVVWALVEMVRRVRAEKAVVEADRKADAYLDARDDATRERDDALGKLRDAAAAWDVERARLQKLADDRGADVDRLVKEIAARAKPGDLRAALNREFGGGS